MVSALDSGSSGPGSGPGWGDHVVFLGKTLLIGTLRSTTATSTKTSPQNRTSL